MNEYNFEIVRLSKLLREEREKSEDYSLIVLKIIAEINKTHKQKTRFLKSLVKMGGDKMQLEHRSNGSATIGRCY